MTCDTGAPLGSPGSVGERGATQSNILRARKVLEILSSLGRRAWLPESGLHTAVQNELWVYPGGGHTGFAQSPAFYTRIRAWYARFGLF